MARPKAKIDAAQVEKLAALQCTFEEIAAFFGCNKSTISRRFATNIAKGREIGKISIRRSLFKILENGNAAMGIWLSKNHLGMKEPKTEIDNAEMLKQLADTIRNFKVAGNESLESNGMQQTETEAKA